jgi:hypothetical protein
MLRELGSAISRVSLFRFVPLPGTEVYRHPETYGIHGTHLQPGWDDDWSRFHIHHNTRRWWGGDAQWAEVEASYPRRLGFIQLRRSHMRRWVSIRLGCPRRFRQ